MSETDLTTRLERLERDNRRLKTFALAAFKKLACTKAGYQETGDNDKGDSGKLATAKASKG